MLCLLLSLVDLKRGPGQSHWNDHQIQQQLVWIQKDCGLPAGGCEFSKLLTLTVYSVWLHLHITVLHPVGRCYMTLHCFTLHCLLARYVFFFFFNHILIMSSRPYHSAGTSLFNILTRFPLQLKCCGVNSSADWKHFKPDGKSVPDSCCLNVTLNCGNGAMMEPTKVYQKVNLL